MATLLPIELQGIYPGIGNYGARIRRFDGLTYDPSNSTFKDETTIETPGPFIPLIQSTIPSEQTLRRAEVSINVAQFVDGDYTIYFHDLESTVYLIVSSIQITVFGGTWVSVAAPTATQIAARMFSVSTASHKIPGSFGEDWNTLVSQVNSIYQGSKIITTRTCGGYCP